ncbi:MAG TPA: class I SAM-dependent methyltransferase [Actinomycetota bacterium]|nr:class I SAM-dependent methyltransferase [Actinomycetota bacterium]
MEDRLRRAAADAVGFMPEDEGLALHDSAAAVAARGPLLEIGSYCGKSTIYLAAAAREAGSVVYAIDHHRGSEEHQPGEAYFDERLLGPDGRVDTFPMFRATIEAAGLDDVVIPIVARSEVALRGWSQPLAFVFIDGSHSAAAARVDLQWSDHLEPGGRLAIHDVFPDPADGGRPPFEIYESALASGRFTEVAARGSLRVLERVDDFL